MISDFPRDDYAAGPELCIQIEVPAGVSKIMVRFPITLPTGFAEEDEQEILADTLVDFKGHGDAVWTPEAFFVAGTVKKVIAQ